MTIMDPLGDMLTRIRNGQRARLDKVRVPYSRLLTSVLKVLKDEGYISTYEVLDVRKGIKEIHVALRYHQGEPVIQVVKRVSKPGRRHFAGHDNFPSIYNGLGISILSTSKGVLADHQARSLSVGGEVLCSVF